MGKSATKATARRGDGSAETASPALASEQGVIQGPVFGRKNYALMGAGAAVIVLGFVTLARGSITLAPLLLVTGYLVLVPLALLKR